MLLPWEVTKPPRAEGNDLLPDYTRFVEAVDDDVLELLLDKGRYIETRLDARKIDTVNTEDHPEAESLAFFVADMDGVEAVAVLNEEKLARLHALYRNVGSSQSDFKSSIAQAVLDMGIDVPELTEAELVNGL